MKYKIRLFRLKNPSSTAVGVARSNGEGLWNRMYLPQDINLYKIAGKKNQENGIGRARQVHRFTTAAEPQKTPG